MKENQSMEQFYKEKYEEHKAIIKAKKAKCCKICKKKEDCETNKIFYLNTLEGICGGYEKDIEKENKILKRKLSEFLK